MAVRIEKVVLTLDDHLSTGMVKAAAATALLDKRLDSLSSAAVQTQGSARSTSREIDGITRSANDADGSINQLTGRLRVIAEVAAMLGPSLVPIGAVAIPAVTGLAAQLGFAAVAGGVLMGSMRGLGEALSAMNKADLEPTAENIAKAKDALDAMAPAAQEFAKEIRNLAPTLKAVRDIGAESLVPGLIESLDHLEELGPRVASIFDSVGGAIGSIAADSSASLASERWAEFFDFIATDAPQALSELSSTIGSITHGMAEMWQAFDPLNDDFSSWLMDAAADFDTFATGLSQTQGFADFVDYIRTNGPQVAETLGAIGGAALDIIQATAPLGGPVLKGLEAAADVISAIADSDLGTPILAGVAALSLLNRSLAVTAALSKTSLGTGLFAGLGTAAAGAKSGAGSIRSLSGDVGILARNYKTAGAASERMAAQSKLATDNLKKLGGAVAGPAALMGGLAIASTGAADGIGLTNTTSLALMGTMLGPWGAALGGAAGALMDVKAQSDALGDSTRALNAAVEANDLAGMTAGIANLKAQLDDVNSRDVDLGALPSWMDDTSFGVLGMGIDNAKDAFSHLTGAAEEGEVAVTAAEKATVKLRLAEVAREEDAKVAALTYARSVGVNMDVGQSALATVKQIEAQAKAMVESREAAQSLMDTFGGLGASLNDSKVSLSGWIAEMEATKQAADNFNDNSIKAVRKGLDEGLVTSLRNAGKEGALRMQQLANGTEEGVKRANRAFRELQRETERTRRVTDRLSDVSIDFKTDKAQAAIEALEAKLRGIADEDVFINVRQIGSTTLGPRDEAADGATVPKTGKPYADRHLYMLADGEEVTSNRHGQADRYRPALKAINSNAPRSVIRGMLADGGTAGNAQERLDVLNAEQAIRELIRSLRADGKNKLGPKAREIAETELAVAKAQLRAAEKAIGQTARDKATEARDAQMEKGRADQEANQGALDAFNQSWMEMLGGQEKATNEWISAAEVQKSSWESIADGFAQQMAAIGADATAPFKSDLFGDSGNAWGEGGAGWRGAFAKDNAGLAERDGLIDEMKAAGFTPEAIAAIFADGATNQQIRSLLADPTGVADFNAGIAERDRLTTDVATSAGRAAYGTQFDNATAEVAKYTAELSTLNAILKGITDQISPVSAAAQEGYDRQGAVLASAVSGAIVNGGNTLARRGTGGY